VFSSAIKEEKKGRCIMRKVVLFFAVLLMAAPAMAVQDVNIICTDDDINCVTVSYQTNVGGVPIRAFGLDIAVDKGNITSVVPVDANYRIYPGQITIVGGQVTGWGTPYAAGDLGDSNVTIEMGSLYTLDPCYAGDPNAGYNKKPGQSGTLLKFYVSSDCNYTVTENPLRGGVVMEDCNFPIVTPGSGRIPPPVPPAPAIAGTITLLNLMSGKEVGKVVTLKIYSGSTLVETLTPTLGSGGSYMATTTMTPPGTYDLYYERMPHWLRLKKAGIVLASTAIVDANLTNGDVTGDNVIDGVDFGQLRTNFLKSGSGLAGDLNEDDVVDGTDFGILRSNFLKSGDPLP